MSYSYGMQGAPAVGKGAPGLPRREAVASEYTPTEALSIYHGASKVSFDAALQRCYVASNDKLFCFNLVGDLIWYVNLGAGGYSSEFQSVGGNGVKICNSSNVASFDSNGNLKWQTTLTGVGTIYSVQGDFADNTYVVSFTSTTNSWVTKLGPTGSVIWSYSFGALANPNVTGMSVAPSGDVWASVQQTVTNTVAEAYKVSAINGGTIPRLRLSVTGTNVRPGSVAVDSGGNIFCTVGRSSGFGVYVFNSAYTLVASSSRNFGTPSGIMNLMATMTPDGGGAYFVGSVDPSGSLTSTPYIATYSFTAPSTLTLVSTIYGNAGSSSASDRALDGQPFFDRGGKFWLTGLANMLKLGPPVSGASYKNIRSAAPTLTLQTDTTLVSSAYTTAYTAVASVTATPGVSTGTLVPVLASASVVIGKVLTDAAKAVLLQTTDA